MRALGRKLSVSAMPLLPGSCVARRQASSVRRPGKTSPFYHDTIDDENQEDSLDLSYQSSVNIENDTLHTNHRSALEKRKVQRGTRKVGDAQHFLEVLRQKTDAFLPQSTKSETLMVSGVTNTPFSPRAQQLLRESARTNSFSSKQWITRAQARRTANAVVLPGEKPTSIFLHVEKVVTLKNLPKATQRRVLDEHPPFFGSGVGILSDRYKWAVVTSTRLCSVLNPTDEERALYIAIDIAVALGIKFDKAKDVVDIREASRVLVYNADQLDDPYKAEPQKGIALNAITGKRMGQPAHDILLAVGILRGYTSPMWIMELQLKYLNAELRRGAEKLAVAAPDMSGLIVSLSALPTPCIKELLSELKNTRRGGLGQDVYYLYSVNGWEVMRSRVLVKNMMALEDQKYPFHFVNANDLQLQKPRYAAYVRKYILRNHKPIGENLLKQESDAEEDGRKSSKTVVQRARRKDGVTFNFFFANDATLRRYYNAACTKQPHLLMPSVRSVAIVNGNLVGRRDEAVLRAFALKNKLSSPIWLTENLAKRLGVHILPKYRNKYVRIGSGAAEANEEDSKADSFYNIDDFAKPSEILSLFPKSSKHAHFMLDAKWRPVVGKQRQEFLKSLGRKTPLWVSVNECLMSGFEVKPNVPSIRFPSAHSSRGEGKGRARGGQGGSRLYNSQYTSDPVRVIGLSTDYVRPQGLHL